MLYVFSHNKKILIYKKCLRWIYITERESYSPHMTMEKWKYKLQKIIHNKLIYVSKAWKNSFKIYCMPTICQALLPALEIKQEIEETNILTLMNSAC